MPLIYYLSLASPLFALIIGAKSRRGIIWWYELVCLVSDLLMSGTKRILHINHFIFANPFFLIEFILISLAFREYINGKLYFLLTTLLLASWFVWNTDGLQTLHWPSVGLFYFAYIVYSVLGFYTIIQKPVELSLAKSSFFWLSVAFIVYGSGAFLLILFRDYFVHNDLALYNQLWKYAFVTLNIMKNIALGVAISQLKPAEVAR